MNLMRNLREALTPKPGKPRPWANPYRSFCDRYPYLRPLCRGR